MSEEFAIRESGYGRVQESKISRTRAELQRQVGHYKERLRRTCAKLIEVLALYQQVLTVIHTTSVLYRRQY